MAEHQNRDHIIFNELRRKDAIFADTFFKEAHWIRIPNAPFDKNKNHMIVYAAQSAAITVLAFKNKMSYEFQIIGW